jgi:hypothetical protein
MDTEEWRDVSGFDMYAVSNFGFIKNKETGRILKMSIRSKGYASVSLMREGVAHKLAVHRVVAFAFVPGHDAVHSWTDHIDGNKLNNRVENLRWCSPTENARNRRIMKNNTSGVTGVYFNKPTGKWMAYIRTQGKMQYLGIYETKEEAEFVRAQAVATEFGEFAPTNNILRGGTVSISWD